MALVTRKKFISRRFDFSKTQNAKAKGQEPKAKGQSGRDSGSADCHLPIAVSLASSTPYTRPPDRRSHPETTRRAPPATDLRFPSPQTAPLWSNKRCQSAALPPLQLARRDALQKAQRE